MIMPWSSDSVPPGFAAAGCATASAASATTTSVIPLRMGLLPVPPSPRRNGTSERGLVEPLAVEKALVGDVEQLAARGGVDGGDRPGDRAQDGVADRVAERVVDPLEEVEV